MHEDFSVESLYYPIFLSCYINIGAIYASITFNIVKLLQFDILCCSNFDAIINELGFITKFNVINHVEKCSELKVLFT